MPPMAAVMHGGAQQDAIRRLHLLEPPVDLVIGQHALFIALGAALVAGHTAADDFIPHVDDLRFDALFFKLIGYQFQGMEGVACCFRTAVERQDLHGS